jgi:opine dehydrogenase
MGFDVNLYNRTPERLSAIQQRGCIQVLTGGACDMPAGDAPIYLATSDIRQALEAADIVMVVVPATAHASVAETCAPYLTPGQFVVLHPGRTGGALEFDHILQEHGIHDEVVVAEAQTLLYACRVINPGQVRVFGIKNSVPVAAIPGHRTPDVVAALRPALPQYVPGDNVMKTSLDNIGAIFHPAVTALNCGRIESTRGDFEFYIDGISRATAMVLEAIDKERIAVAHALGFHCMSAREWLYIAYGAAGSTLFDAIRANQGYYGIKAPHSIDTRYIWEDVPMSLVPIASLGGLMCLPCTSIRATIHLAGLMHGRDYWAEGRTVEKIGLSGMSLLQIRRLVLDGIWPNENGLAEMPGLTSVMELIDGAVF